MRESLLSFTENPVYVFCALCFLVILAIYAGKTKLGSKFGPALLVIVFTAIVANLGLLPSASNAIPLYDGIFKYLAPISIFFLLLGVNLTSIRKAGTPMIVLFLLGSFATTIAVVIAYSLIGPQDIVGEDAKILAGMYAGTYTGGSVNFNAVALEYNFQEKGALYAGSVAVDNVVSTLWIIFTLLIPVIMTAFWKPKRFATSTTTFTQEEAENFDFRSLIWLVFLGILCFFLSELLSEYFPQIPSIITLSTFGILLAQTPFVSKLKGSHSLGLYLVYIFLAVIGAYCELSAVAELQDVGITLFLFAGLIVIFHGIITIFLGGLIYRDWEMIAIASQANIGGGTTAIALAETFGRKELMLPAILVGSLGTALGTYLGFLIVAIL